MPYAAKLILDSVGPNKARLTTFECTYPKFVHGELMTHRLFSRNAASSRAIPAKRIREMVLTDPALPVWWGKNQAGMQAATELEPEAKQEAFVQWLEASRLMTEAHEKMEKLGVHKQITNRILEPWLHITTIITATDYENWFFLRDHPDAQPEIAWVAREMHKLYKASTPQELPAGHWHLPYTRAEDWAEAHKRFPAEPYKRVHFMRQISVARCARVSYLTQNGVRDCDEDVKKHDDLRQADKPGAPGHWSPFEHVAQAQREDELERSGNFTGFNQYRKLFAGEHAGKEVRP